MNTSKTKLALLTSSQVENSQKNDKKSELKRRSRAINEVLISSNSPKIQKDTKIENVASTKINLINNKQIQVISEQLPYLTMQSVASIESDKKLALQEALLINVEKKAEKYNKYKNELDEKETNWRKISNFKENTRGKLINKTK